jgi:hypothetical protein
MAKTSFIQVMKIVAPEDVLRPYRLIETFVTSEGMRTRLCSGAFDTFEQADGHRKELEAATNEAAA